MPHSLDKCDLIVNTEFEALHYWEDTKSFLQFPHHHRFLVQFRITTISGDMNRSLEFFDVRRVLNECIREMIRDHDQHDKGYDTLGFGVLKLSTEAMGSILLDNMCEKEMMQLEPAYCVELECIVTEDGYAGSTTRRTVSSPQ